MIFLFLTLLASSTGHYSPKNIDILENIETECFYDQNYTESITSNSVVCLIRCHFISIKSTTAGGAVIISLRNRFGQKNLIDNCSFIKCSAKYGGAIFINIEKNCSTYITNSTFENNSASTSSGGAIYISSIIKIYTNIQNCIFKNNSAKVDGGSIYINCLNFSINKCKFINNSLRIQKEDKHGAGIYSKDSVGSFTNSTFEDNVIFIEQHDIYDAFGGSLAFENSNIHLNECLFTNNREIVISSYSKPYGGAIYFLNSNGSFVKCKFTNNLVYKESNNNNYVSEGGAVAFSNSIVSIFNCIFENNTIYSKSGKIYGGAIYYSGKNSSIKMCTFINNTSYKVNSNDSNGGAIYFLNNNVILEDNNFTQNRVYSNGKNSYGGAISLYESKGICQNCFFNCNSAETFIGIYLISGKEPISLGGSAYLEYSKLYFSNCTFLNNTGFGNSPKHVSTGKGGAIHSVNSTISISQCNFINNTLCNYGHKFDIDCYIEGGACFCQDSYADIADCEFTNNTIVLYASEQSVFFSARIYGGAIYFRSTQQSLNCINCKFTNNTVLIPNNQQKEFAGAVYLENGILKNCTFLDNTAYNGGDIRYDQNSNCKLSIKKCTFLHKTIFNHQIKSLIYFRGNNNISNTNLFSQNKVILNIPTILFDGDNRINDDESKIIIFKFVFDYNCISPYDNKYFISNDFPIFDSKYEQIALKTAFTCDCNEYIDPTESPYITETVKPSSSIKPKPTSSIKPKPTSSIKPMPTASELYILNPTATKYLKPTESPNPTETKSLLNPTATSIPSSNLTKQPKPTITETFIQTTEYPKTDQLPTDTDIFISQTASITSSNNQQNDLKEENQISNNKIFILMIFIIVSQSILIFLVLLLLICLLKRKKRSEDHSSMTTSLIELV